VAARKSRAKSKGSKKPGVTRDRLPSREQVLAFISDSDGEVGRRDIARAFGLSSADRAALKPLLRDLVDEGVLSRGRKRRVAAPGAPPPVLVVEITGLDRDGDPFAAPSEWRGEGPAPRIIIVPDRKRRGPALGIGDRALVKISKTGEGTYDGRIIRALTNRPGRAVGVYHKIADGGRVQATDRRARAEFFVPDTDSMGAQGGELVIVEIGRERWLGLPSAKVVERLGQLDSPQAVSILAINAHGIPTDFSPDALAQADAARAPTLRGRVDLRDLPLVTIDDADARDFDDAVWAEPDDDPQNPGGWHIVVAIADVAHYVRPGDAIDRDAATRGNSVYFPDRVVPMLPEPLSNGWCSLRPGENRACLAVHIWLDRNGEQRRHRIERGLMKSAARLTYADVQAARDGSGEADTAARIAPLYGAYQAFAKARRKRGALELDMPERRVVFDDEGHVVALAPRLRYDSHRLIEEFMIAANVAVAETLAGKGAPCMYRVHDQPPLDKLQPLREFLGSLGHKLARSRHVMPSQFNRILNKVAGTPESHVISMVILRAQSQAEYSPHNIGHFGLGLDRYAHFTSPIRRYADLLVHRALIRALKLGAGGLPDNAAAGFEELGAAISATERRAAKAEHDAFDRYATRFLADHVGAELAGRISGVTRFGLFVTLDEAGADGLIPMRQLGALGGEYFHHDEARHRLVGDHSGTTFALGQAITVRLAEADVVTGSLRFEPLGLTDQGRRPPERGRRRGRR
jgi:ribonuclease R